MEQPPRRKTAPCLAVWLNTPVASEPTRRPSLPVTGLLTCVRRKGSWKPDKEEWARTGAAAVSPCARRGRRGLTESPLEFVDTAGASFDGEEKKQGHSDILLFLFWQETDGGRIVAWRGNSLVSAPIIGRWCRQGNMPRRCGEGTEAGEQRGTFGFSPLKGGRDRGWRLPAQRKPPHPSCLRDRGVAGRADSAHRPEDRRRNRRQRRQQQGNDRAGGPFDHLARRSHPRPGHAHLRRARIGVRGSDRPQYVRARGLARLHSLHLSTSAGRQIAWAG